MQDIAYLAGMTYTAVELAKQAGLSSRFAGVVSLVLGVAIAALDGAQRGESVEQAPAWITNGIVAGLTASGLQSGTKAVLTKPRGAEGADG